MQVIVQGFRTAVIAVAIAGLGVAWNWHLTWLLVLSLVFGAEEILESTTHLSTLRRTPPGGWFPAARQSSDCAQAVRAKGA